MLSSIPQTILRAVHRQSEVLGLPLSAMLLNEIVSNGPKLWFHLLTARFDGPIESSNFVVLPMYLIFWGPCSRMMTFLGSYEQRNVICYHDGTAIMHMVPEELAHDRSLTKGRKTYQSNIARPSALGTPVFRGILEIWGFVG